MSTRLTATENKVTAITAKLQAPETEQKKMVEEAKRLISGMKITDLVILENLERTVDKILAFMFLV